MVELLKISAFKHNFSLIWEKTTKTYLNKSANSLYASEGLFCR